MTKANNLSNSSNNNNQQPGYQPAPAPATATIKAAGYCRVSTAAQATPDKISLQDQEQKIRSECEKRGWQCVQIYADPGISGELMEGRPALQQMLRDAETGQFHVLIIYNLDRLSRTSHIAMHIYHQLTERNRIQILDLATPAVIQNPVTFDHRADEGQLLNYGIRALLAQTANREKARRSAAGTRNRVRQGKYLAPNTPYGYRVAFVVPSDGSAPFRGVEPDPDEWQFIKMLPDLLLKERLSFREMANRLTKLGATTREGGYWQSSTLAKIVTNPFYAGVIRYGYRSKSIREGHLLRQQDPTKITTGEHPYEKAWTVEEFEAMQAEINQRVENLRSGKLGARAAGSILNPLAGLLRCGHCGGSLHWVNFTASSWGKFRCKLYEENKALCPRTSNAPARLVVEVIWHDLNQLAAREVANPVGFHQEIEVTAFAASGRLERQATESKLAELNKEIGEVYESRKANLNKALLDGMPYAAYSELLVGLESEKLKHEVKRDLLLRKMSEATKAVTTLTNIRGFSTEVQSAGYKFISQPLGAWTEAERLRFRTLTRKIYKTIAVKATNDVPRFTPPNKSKWELDVEFTYIWN